jgi:hypothetical protein
MGMKRDFALSNAQEVLRIQRSGARKPLRTFTEFVEEFGVPKGVLQYALTEDGAPKVVLTQANKRTTNNRWYDPQEMRQWWKNRKTKA